MKIINIEDKKYFVLKNHDSSSLPVTFSDTQKIILDHISLLEKSYWVLWFIFLIFLIVNSIKFIYKNYKKEKSKKS